MRELTPKGLIDRSLVTEYLMDKQIDAVLSSPFRRAIDTIKPFAEQAGLSLQLIADFRERKTDSVWIEDFHAFCKQQWEDFSYKLSDGESLGEVQKRNIKALKQVLSDYAEKNVVIGSHATSLSTILNYFDNTFGQEQFQAMKSLMPWIVKFTFEKETFISVEMIDVFQQK